MLKKNSLLGRLVPYIAVVVLCFALFFCLSKAYDGDEASYVTVQNGETEVYNGVSIGDIIAAVLSLCVTLILGIATYLQTRDSNDIETWSKAPYYYIDTDSDLFNTEGAGYEFGKRRVLTEDYEDNIHIQLRSINDIRVFSIDPYIVDQDNYSLYYINSVSDDLDMRIGQINIPEINEESEDDEGVVFVEETGWYRDKKGIESDKKELKELKNLFDHYVSSEFYFNEVRDGITVKLNENFWKQDKEDNEKKFIFGLDILTANNYRYQQLFRVDLLCMGKDEQGNIIYLFTNIDTELVGRSDLLTKRQIKKYIKKFEGKKARKSKKILGYAQTLKKRRE